MSKPIRILHVLGRLDRGGAETMVMNLYRRMDRERIQFDFVLHTEEKCSYTEEVERMGGRIYAMPAFCLNTVHRYRRAWRRFLTQHPEYRILHSHIRSTAALYLPLAKEKGMVTIIHSHNTSSGKGLQALVKNVLQYPLRYQADYLFACGKEAGEWLYGPKACRTDRFVILPNAIEISRFQFCPEVRKEVRSRFGLLETTLAAVHVGRLEEQKNHVFLLEIFAALQRLVPDSRLFILGEGPLEKRIKRLAAEKQIVNSVEFLGSRNDVDAILQGMDVFLFPSLYEGLPVTVIEAQAADVPVIASENITKEAVLTGSAVRISLKESAAVWAGKAAEAAGYEPQQDKGVWRRADGNGRLAQRKAGAGREAVKAAGYDIADTAEWLADFYRKRVSENER